jgi:hypothetical protein
MNKSVAKQYKTGIYIGKFFPLHLGHISTINMINSVCEKVYVIFYNDKNAEIKLIRQAGYSYDINLRINDAKRIFETNDDIIVTKLDIPADITFPDNYEDIKALVHALVADKIDIQIFGCDEKEIYAPYVYADEFMLGGIYAIEDKDAMIKPLHATLIRTDYDYYKKYLPSIVEQTITKLKI